MVFEQEKEGSYDLLVFLSNISLQESLHIRSSKITTRIIKEADYLLTLLRLGNSSMIFELAFDPTLYKDERINQFLKSNIVKVMGVDSTNYVLKALRVASLPKKLYEEWLVAWTKAFKIEDFSLKYKKWLDDLESRYSVVQLWDMGKNSGYFGD